MGRKVFKEEVLHMDRRGRVLHPHGLKRRGLKKSCKSSFRFSETRERSALVQKSTEKRERTHKNSNEKVSSVEYGLRGKRG